MKGNMGHGLMPTQMEEMRKKHRTRLFFEERLLEIVYIIRYIYNTIHTLSRILGLIVVLAKKYIGILLFATLVTVMMLW
jgi:hypothetical protein